MKKTILTSIISFTGICLIFWSCHWKTIEPVSSELLTDTISFSLDLEPLFIDKCSSCHSSQVPILTEGNSYQAITSGGYVNLDVPELSLIYTKMKDEEHPSPSGTFSQTELAKLLAWIEQGALNN